MLKPGSPEWKQRRAQLLTDELKQPMRWFYLSFADDHQFLGAVIIQACGAMHAVERTSILGINPGGEVALFAVPDDQIPPDAAKNRLLNLDEVRTLIGPVVKPFE